MAIRVECPKCEAVLNAPKAAAGKTVACPKCNSAIKLPAADPGFEVVEPKPKRPPLDDEPAPRRRPRLEDDDDDDARRPRRKPRRDDEEKSISIPLVAGIAVGASVLILVLGLWLGGVFKGKDDDKKEKETAANNAEASNENESPSRRRPIPSNKPEKKAKPAYSKGAPPAGWSLADAERFACFLPGDAHKQFGLDAARTSDSDASNYESWHSFDLNYEYTAYAYELRSKTPGNTQSALEGLYEDLKIDINRKAPWNINHKQEMRTASGMPCLVMTSEKDLKFAGGTPDAESKANQEFNTAIVMARGKRVYIFKIVTRGQPFGEERLKILLDSFEERL
jgi:hypothetical protein